MKYYFTSIILFASLLFSNSSYAQSKQLAKVQSAVVHLTNAMVSGDRAALEMVASNNLSYGHSGGHIEGKAEFVEKIASGKSDFVSIDITDQTISINGKTAIVRHLLNAVTNDNGKAGVVKLKVLLVFLRAQGQWKMLARQAVKA